MTIPKLADVVNMTENQLSDARNDLLAKIDELDEVVNSGGKWDDNQRKNYAGHVELLEAVTNAIGNTPQGLREKAEALRVVHNLSNVSKNANLFNGSVKTRPAWEDDPKKGFESDGQFLNAVVNMYRNGGTEDDRLKAVINAVGSDEYSRGSWESAGVAIPRGFLGTVLKTTSEQDFITSRMTPVAMGTTSLDIVARVDKDHRTSVTGGTIAYRTSETKTVELTKDKYETVSLKAHELNVATAATKQIMRDSPISIASLIESSFPEAIQYKRTEEYLFGDGNGRPLGALSSNNSALLTLDRTDGQADAVILSGQDIYNMRKRVYKYDQSVWIANIDLYDILSNLVIESPNNAGIVKLFYPQNPVAGMPDTLLGRPVIWTEFAPGVTSGNSGSDITEWDSKFLSCVNFSQMLYGYRSVDTMERSMHVRFLEREDLFLFTTEDDARPWWKTTLIPKRGVSTMSPFVTLSNTSVA